MKFFSLANAGKKVAPVIGRYILTNIHTILLLFNYIFKTEGTAEFSYEFGEFLNFSTMYRKRSVSPGADVTEHFTTAYEIN